MRRSEGPAAASQSVDAKSFSDNLSEQQEKQGQEQVSRLLAQIRQQSDRLSRSMNVRELRQYRVLLRQFIGETSRRGVGLKDTRGQDRGGNNRRYKLLEELDGHLLKLTDELLDSEEGRLLLLSRMGEIKGMLINIST